MPQFVTCGTHKDPTPKSNRQSQNSRKRVQVETCDADNMKTKNFDKVLNAHSGQNIIKQEDAEAVQSEDIDKTFKLSEEEVTQRMRSMAYAMHEPIKSNDTTPIPVPVSTDDRPRQRSSRTPKKVELMSSFSEGAREAKECKAGCGCSHENEPEHNSADPDQEPADQR